MSGWPYGMIPAGTDMWELPESIPIIGKKNRCMGCGKFMPKQLGDEAYVEIEPSYGPCHLNETCLEKALEKRDKK